MRVAKWPKVSAAVGALAMAAVIGMSGEMAVSAQAPSQGRPSADVQAFNACTTTDYANVAAKALNTTSAALRKALVGGQTLQQIATTANVDIKTVSDAISAARKAEIDQAVTAGLLTQADATALEAAPNAQGGPGGQGKGGPGGGQGGAPNANGGQGGPGGGQGASGGQSGPGTILGGTPNANGGTDEQSTTGGQNGAPNGGGRPGGRPGNGGPGGGQGAFGLPDISTITSLLAQSSGTSQTAPNNRRGGGAGFADASFNLVKPDEVAAQALDMKCTDLVKTLLTGKSIQDVASSQSVDPQVVITAISKAYTDALAQDVTDGVITQAQSDTLSANVAKNAATFVSGSMSIGQRVAPTPSS